MSGWTQLISTRGSRSRSTVCGYNKEASLKRAAFQLGGVEVGIGLKVNQQGIRTDSCDFFGFRRIKV